MPDIATRRVRPWKRPEGDGGVTLVELLVSMGVFSIVIGLLFTAVIAVQQMAARAQSAAESVSQLRQGLAVIDRQVRSGNVLYSPASENNPTSCEGGGTSGSCMRVYTQANGDERCVQWQVVPSDTTPGTSELRMRSWSPTWSVDGKHTSWETVAQDLVPAGVGNWPFNLQDGTTTYKSRLLDVRLQVRDLAQDGRVDELRASISGRNTNYGYDAGRCDSAPAG